MPSKARNFCSPRRPNAACGFAPRCLVPLWAAVVIGVVILIAALPGRARKWDYSIYYTSALAMREGMNPYTKDLTPLAHSLRIRAGQNKSRDGSADFCDVLCAAGRLLPPRLWVLCLDGDQRARISDFAGPAFSMDAGARSRDGALAIAALTIALFPPVTDHLVWGQNKMLVLLMFVLMLRWMERGRDAPAGLMLAFASLLRAFPLLLVGYLILMKRWRMVTYLVIGLAIGGLLTVALAGIDSTQSFALAPTYLTEQWREALPGNIALGTDGVADVLVASSEFIREQR